MLILTATGAFKGSYFYTCMNHLLAVSPKDCTSCKDTFGFENDVILTLKLWK